MKHPKIDVKELTDEIYDVLMGNVGLSPYHVDFQRDKVTSAFCNASEGNIYLAFNHKAFEITVKPIKYHPELE